MHGCKRRSREKKMMMPPSVVNGARAKKKKKKKKTTTKNRPKKYCHPLLPIIHQKKESTMFHDLFFPKKIQKKTNQKKRKQEIDGDGLRCHSTWPNAVLLLLLLISHRDISH
jgi:hypothetical protein